MSQSLANILIHMVFSTKDRMPFLQDADIRSQMHAELGGISKSLNCLPMIVGGVEDHIHLLARQSRTISLSEWVKELKRVTSLWIKEKSPRLQGFAWQSGYGAFSVSPSQSNKVIQYIREQEAHHQRQDFKSEFRKLLERHSIEYDERYVWD
ncbi:MAG: IS200/IS605 family transposase [Planctomycetaceae bacterium]|nr:IS200/IS605 family transposase [Planctomycetaceae bacterium]